jgi:hypothetical protein
VIPFVTGTLALDDPLVTLPGTTVIGLSNNPDNHLLAARWDCLTLLKRLSVRRMPSSARNVGQPIVLTFAQDKPRNNTPTPTLTFPFLDLGHHLPNLNQTQQRV